MKMKHPLATETARCLGSNCDRKENCARYLSIDIDVKDYMWFFDGMEEIKELECSLFIDFRNGNYYEN